MASLTFGGSHRGEFAIESREDAASIRLEGKHASVSLNCGTGTADLQLASSLMGAARKSDGLALSTGNDESNLSVHSGTNNNHLALRALASGALFVMQSPKGEKTVGCTPHGYYENQSSKGTEPESG
ncbi:MAG: hypothetical protein AB7F50_11320 [Fimbriimonadaceae bacterium]